MSPKKKTQKDPTGSARLVLIFITIIVLVLIVSVLLGSGFLGKSANGSLTANANSTIYNSGDSLKLSLSNDSAKNICFSSCPYLFQSKKDGNWQTYDGVKCQETEKRVVKICISSNRTKTMSLMVPAGPANLRLEIPYCSNCKEGEDFTEEGKIYSNEFTIN